MRDYRGAMLEGISEVNVQVVVGPLSGKVLWVEHVKQAATTQSGYTEDK